MRQMNESGMDWIGNVPNDWKKIKLNEYYDFEKGKNAAVYTREYIGENIGEYPVYSGQTENNGIMGKINTYDYDLKECLYTTTVGANVMTPRIIKGKFSLSQNCLIMRKKKSISNKFMLYMLITMFDYEKSMIPVYMQPSLRIDDLNTYKCYVPEIRIQNRISDFLDNKTNIIDDIIEKTKDTIENYKKIKYSLIFDCITKGLNKKIELKGTGNIHIGKIPSNWTSKKIKYLFEIRKDIAGKEGYDILSITQNGIRIKDVTKNEGQVAANYSNYQLVEVGDFAMNHMDLLTGWVDISKFNGVTSPDYRVFRLKDNENNDSKYYLYLMQMCYMGRIFYDLGQGVSNIGRWRLQSDKFLNFIVPNPTIEEQRKISQYLDFKCNEIDNLISNKHNLIEELKQYKKSLIYEYVTGKKEVV